MYLQKLPDTLIDLLMGLTTTRKNLGKGEPPSFNRKTRTFLRQAKAVIKLIKKLLETKTPFQPAPGITSPKLPGKMANALKHLFYAVLTTMGIVVKGPKLVFYNSSVIHLDNVEQAIQIAYMWVMDKKNFNAAKKAPLFNVSKYKFPCQHPGCKKGGNNEGQLAKHMEKCPFNPKKSGTKHNTSSW